MRTRILLVLTLLAALGSQAQNSPKNFSLQQCIDYALANNTAIKNATLDEYIASAKVDEYVGSGLPQITGSAGVQASDPLRKMYLRKGEDSFFPFPPGTQNGDVVAFPNVFQLQNTVDASVSVTQLIFSSSYFYGLKAAKTYRDLATTSKEVSKVDVTQKVTKAYYMALINAERKKLFDVNIGRLDSLLKQTKAMNKAGFAEKLDVDRLEVTYNNLLTEKNNFENMLMLSTLLLKYQMNLPLTEELSLADKLENIKIDSTQVTANKADYNNRAEYKLLQRQKTLNQLNYKRYAYGFLPTLAFNGSVGYFTQSPNFDFSHEFSRYGNYGVGLNVPIFTGFTRLKQVQQAKYELNKTDNNIQQFERTVDLQVASAELTYKNSMKTLSSQSRNMELAKEVARVTQVKYKAGTGSNLEVVEAESSLKTAQINYFNAFYDALVSKVDFDIALGILK